jgi:hypothetical protein
MKRKTKNNIPKPNYLGSYRQIHGVLRDVNGFMIFSEIENNNVVYRLTKIKDFDIKADKNGRREFNKRFLPFLEKNVVDNYYVGDLYMYCTHQEKQTLLPISEFTINRGAKQYHRMNMDGHSYQPYCKESKKLYQNSQGNKLRDKNQLLEGSQGSRTRGLLTSMYYGKNTKCPSIEEIFEKFGGKCFKTGKELDINDRNSYEIDHLMPASGYFPLCYKTATLLSKESNQSKNDLHPKKYYGEKKFEELCRILEYPMETICDENYTLNDEVLFYFNNNFDTIIKKWENNNRNKNSFKKYVNKEMNRISKKDIYNKHTDLILKLKTYYEKNI